MQVSYSKKADQVLEVATRASLEAVAATVSGRRRAIQTTQELPTGRNSSM